MLAERAVVYRTIPTSNHNHRVKNKVSRKLYIVLFLHQTTTNVSKSHVRPSCISYYSYIKPQLWHIHRQSCCVVYRTIPTSNHNSTKHPLIWCTVVYRTIPTSNHNVQNNGLQSTFVVYRTIPTSNHNSFQGNDFMQALYIVLFLHQTTTIRQRDMFSGLLYIVLFLHQTTTIFNVLTVDVRCISYYSYIKPQLEASMRLQQVVVYRTIPTSNHNWGFGGFL